MNDSSAFTNVDCRILEAFESPMSRKPNPDALADAERWLRQGIPVVIPTETVYGLAARALDRRAVEAIFRIKGRPLDNPLIVHVAGVDQLAGIGAEPSPLALQLIERFWPGPLTLVVTSRACLPWVTAGLDSIAVRYPAHAFAAALIALVGPLAAPSANLSGRPSPTRAQHAAQDLLGRVPLVVDGGDLEHGLESTVVDVRGDTPILLRAGAVSVEALEAALGRSVHTSPRGALARSPGMKYRHYSPRAELWLYPAPTLPGSAPRQELEQDALELRGRGRRVGAITERAVEVDHFIARPSDAKELARHLFGWLRELDELGVDCILVEGVARTGVGRAVMDRLERAATRVRGVGEPDLRGPDP